jgi:hypothetical protein
MDPFLSFSTLSKNLIKQSVFQLLDVYESIFLLELQRELTSKVPTKVGRTTKLTSEIERIMNPQPNNRESKYT